VRASYGSVLIPLFDEDALRMGEIARRARLSRQTITTMVRLCERDGLVARRPDPDDGRATLVHLTAKARRFRAGGRTGPRPASAGGGGLARTAAPDRAAALAEGAVAMTLRGFRFAWMRASIPRLAVQPALSGRPHDRSPEAFPHGR
jgi:hypothetical protein